jgi:hypothetical protein
MGGHRTPRQAADRRTPRRVLTQGQSLMGMRACHAVGVGGRGGGRRESQRGGREDASTPPRESLALVVGVGEGSRGRWEFAVEKI